MITFFPDGTDEILQNVHMILSTVKGSEPLNRDFGISALFLDAPTPKAIAMLRAEIAEAIPYWEPRAVVSEVTFEGDMNGRVYPRVKVRQK